MFRTIATGMLARRLGRGITRMSPNPLVRMAGMAAAGMLAARLMQPKRDTRTARVKQPSRRRGLFARGT